MKHFTTNFKSVVTSLGTVMLLAPAIATANCGDLYNTYYPHKSKAIDKHHAMQSSMQHNMQSAYHKTSYSMTKADMNTQPDIVDTAVGAGNFNTLVTAVKAAGLVGTLKGKGPYTVFAPTDEAFAKVPKATLDALLADKAALRKVLLYHVVPGKVTSSQVVKLTSAKTAQGSSVSINASNGVMIDNAKVVKADIETSNGIIHVIDSVILPK